jgi:hypothetical protein
MANAQVYQMLRLDNDAKRTPAHYDWLLAGGEADARAYHVLRRASDWGLSFENVLLCDFIERRAAGDASARAAYESYSSLTVKITPLVCSLRRVLRNAKWKHAKSGRFCIFLSSDQISRRSRHICRGSISRNQICGWGEVIIARPRSRATVSASRLMIQVRRRLLRNS